ncbi:SRP54-domain-containing protein [Calocera viscosa TUFC12733]|uniref:signal-recognition-particle GTPase n=1 Tax=Calocera viscosa (strain TUFC12733) TaxID=1330018 RepID=A0A167GW43_CALVF|nr:SRP54-domain-containing protein [Calocera viscosa TUFC12733]
MVVYQCLRVNKVRARRRERFARWATQATRRHYGTATGAECWATGCAWRWSAQAVSCVIILADLGRRINGARSALNRAPTIDDKPLDAMLKEICTALLESDVNVKLVASSAALEGDERRDAQRKNVVQKAVFDELVGLINPGVEPYRPKKGQPNVLIAVGLQTTTCTKLAVFYQKRGFKSCILCADTFRAGAFDQTRHSATKAKVAYFGSYTETDPVVIAAQGVDKFRKERCEIIIADTSGRHKQEMDLFQDIDMIGRPIGQAAEAQSRAFKESADFGAIIVTKMDGHAKGGGAISACISKMLGMGDIQGLVEHMQDIAQQNPEKQTDVMKNLEQGKFSIRDWREQVGNGPNIEFARMIPGLPHMAGSENKISSKFKRMIYMTGSMIGYELESDGLCSVDMEKDGKTPIRTNWCVQRVARGSETSVAEVEDMLFQYRMMANMAKGAGGKNGWLQAMQKMQPAAGGRGRGPNGMPTPAQIQAIGGAGGEMLDMAEMQRMKQGMGMRGAGGKPGMPNMGDMMRMMGEDGDALPACPSVWSTED